MAKLLGMNLIIICIIGLIAYYQFYWFAGSVAVALVLFNSFIIYFERNLLGGAGGLESEFEDYEPDIYPNNEPFISKK